MAKNLGKDFLAKGSGFILVRAFLSLSLKRNGLKTIILRLS